MTHKRHQPITFTGGMRASLMIAKQVQRQMKCAEEGGCLNREWTRIHANSCSAPVWVRFELLFNPGGLRSHGTKTVHFPVFLILFAFIRVHSRPFAVQNCFPPTISMLLTCRAVRSSASLTNSLDSMPRTLFVHEPEYSHSHSRFILETS